MSKINLTYDGKKYTLEYTRATVRDMERRGFNVAEVDSKPMNNLPVLFEGAFLANHPDTPAYVVDEILRCAPNKAELWQTLSEMCAEPYKFLFDEADEGNVIWSAGE